MKSLLTFLTMVGSLYLCGQHTLKVEVSGIKKIEGAIEVCLFDSPDNYMKEAIKCFWLDVSEDLMECSFDSLSSAFYAVVIIQDLNGNEDLDTNFMGIPKEPYGFSNNPSTTFGPPSFDGASFLLEGNRTINIKLK